MDMSRTNPRMSPVRRTDVQNGRTDVTDVRTDVKEKKDAREVVSRDEPSGSPAQLAPKKFEEAGDDELCGPPKNMWAEVKKRIK